MALTFVGSNQTTNAWAHSVFSVFYTKTKKHIQCDLYQRNRETTKTKKLLFD